MESNINLVVAFISYVQDSFISAAASSNVSRVRAPHNTGTRGGRYSCCPSELYTSINQLFFNHHVVEHMLQHLHSSTRDSRKGSQPRSRQSKTHSDLGVTEGFSSTEEYNEVLRRLWGYKAELPKHVGAPELILSANYDSGYTAKPVGNGSPALTAPCPRPCAAL